MSAPVATPTSTGLHELACEDWTPVLAEAERAAVQEALERGAVIYLPRLAFRVEPSESRFLSPRWSDGRAKNISLRPNQRAPHGAVGAPEDLAALGALLARYAALAEALVKALFPRYAAGLVRAGTTFRPCEIEGRPAASWRKDDTRLHVDAFPSNPVRGLRILRVFSNADPEGRPRVWRIGEPFESVARRFLPRIPRPLPGAAWLLEAIGATKSRRSEYDHLMLGLHDRAKADTAYQRDCAQLRIEFPAGSTWIVFTDQVMHAALAGRNAFEQTFYLPAEDLALPQTAPLAVLERLCGRALV